MSIVVSFEEIIFNQRHSLVICVIENRCDLENMFFTKTELHKIRDDVKIVYCGDVNIRPSMD